jgi:hypothetical protein
VNAASRKRQAKDAPPVEVACNFTTHGFTGKADLDSSGALEYGLGLGF